MKDAEADFQQAIKLNPNNVVAKVNLRFNQELQAGTEPKTLKLADPVQPELGKYKSWLDAIRDNGPLDQPTACFGEAHVLARGGNLRQSAQLFERVHELLPEDAGATYWLAQTYLAIRMPDKALKLLNKLDEHISGLDELGIGPVELTQSKAVALYSAGKSEEAESLLDDAIKQNPKDTKLLKTAAQVSAMFGRYTNALSIVDHLLQVKPDDPTALVNRGFLNMQMRNFEQAIPPLTRALDLNTNNYTARLDRAIAYLSDNKLDEARQDYQVLESQLVENSVTNRLFQIYYGLGDIAYRQKDTNSAIHYYQLYLSNSAPRLNGGGIRQESPQEPFRIALSAAGCVSYM